MTSSVFSFDTKRKVMLDGHVLVLSSIMFTPIIVRVTNLYVHYDSFGLKVVWSKCVVTEIRIENYVEIMCQALLMMITLSMDVT